MLKTIKEKLGIEDIVGIFLIISPFVDILTSLSVTYFNTGATIGTSVRSLFLLYFIYYTLFRGTTKYKTSIIYLLLILFYSALFIINIYINKGMMFVVPEFKFLIKAFYFPILSIAFFNYYKDHKFNYKIFKSVAIIYALLIFIPIVTGTSFSSYSLNEVGYKGWYYAANEVGAIITLLLPFVIYEFISNTKKKSMYIFTLLYLFVMVQIGTKVPLFALILIFLSFVILFILKTIDRRKEIEAFTIKKSVLTYFLIILISIQILFVFSPISEVISIRTEQLKYDNTKQTKEKVVDFVFSSRDKYFIIVSERFNDATINNKLLGIGAISVDEGSYLNENITEIDYTDVFFRYGFIGSSIYFMSILYLIFISFLKNNNFKKLLNNNFQIIKIISLLLAFGIALFAGHVFIAPAVSIYIALLFNNEVIK